MLKYGDVDISRTRPELTAMDSLIQTERVILPVVIFLYQDWIYLCRCCLVYDR